MESEYVDAMREHFATLAEELEQLHQAALKQDGLPPATASASIDRSIPSCFKANSRCESKSSSGARSTGTASSSSIDTIRVTGRTRAGRDGGQTPSPKCSCRYA